MRVQQQTPRVQGRMCKLRESHGLDPEAADSLIEIASLIETSACSVTGAPTTDYGAFATSIQRYGGSGCCTYTGSMLRFETGSDLFPSKTEVSNYYTSGAAISTGSVTATGSAKASSTGMTSSASTQASGTGANAAALRPPLSLLVEVRPELKAVGGLVMAFLGVMAAL